MSTSYLIFAPPLAAFALSAAVLFAPSGSAVPQCTNVSPQTTVCATNGSNQIVTSPPPMDFGYGWPGWGWGGNGLIISLG